MASSSKKNLPLSDETNLLKMESKSTKSESGLRISADPAFNFNNLDFSGMDSIVNKPKIKELAEKMSRDPDQRADQLRRTMPTAYMKERFPDYDPERCINIIRQDLENPRLIKMRERLFNHLPRDPQMSPKSRSETPVDVNNPAGPIGGFP